MTHFRKLGAEVVLLLCRGGWALLARVIYDASLAPSVFISVWSGGLNGVVRRGGFSVACRCYLRVCAGMDSLFGTAGAAQKSGSPAASNGAASRKPGSKKCKNRSARYPKTNNNPPYLPPEVSLLWFSRAQTHLSVLLLPFTLLLLLIASYIYISFYFCISQGLWL